MRRSSKGILQSQTSEPVVIVNVQENEENSPEKKSFSTSSADESPLMNPYLLSPFMRDVRKLSLPSPQCSGITASQVRRLSERGETTGPGPRQAEFLATLSTAQQPTPGGRRHSVVTISKVPTSFFGRNRRESVASFPCPSGRVLPNRRESIACPPSTENRGSVHNLQLDIMDDIVQSRKVRMKLWNTSSEKLCEVQPLDQTGGIQRYTNSSRRFSDFVGTTLAPIPSSKTRRASELPQAAGSSNTSNSTSKKPNIGIICSNNDLISILSPLSTSASELNQSERNQTKEDPLKNWSLHQKRSRLKSNRSISFDISFLHGTAININENKTFSPPNNWFVKRHQLKSKIEDNKSTSTENVDVVDTEPGKVVWDERSGSLVNAHVLGSAIEDFLKYTSPETTLKTSSNIELNKTKGNRSTKANWFAKGDDDLPDTCDSSLCSTLKDLFVK
ncbi:unnamed protein product [Brassicogethes aeneus]|uniref:Uncharacterized protein n=1 Tax=Brassicogethes aeneus TaxID=1431903 RepID=A0A9P0BA55_BRAAE|nr:unnamed protein product [Brassicogethes aeneus]